MSDRLLTIAIPTWNNTQQLMTCLTSMYRWTEFPYRVIVVDNGNDPQLAASAKEWPMHIDYLASETNRGWMGGVNLAFQHVETPFFAMMNDDVVFPPNSQTFWRTLLYEFSDPDVGLVGPASDFIAGKQNIRVPTGIVFDTSFAIGVCLVTRTELFRELGGLDESLPGGDDLDLTIRVRKAGKKVRIRKDAFLHHEGQQSGRRKQGAFYDSEDHQDIVKNALIRKHGLRWQYETWQMLELPITRHQQGAGTVQGDREWAQERIHGDAIDVGCGSNPHEGALGVDARAPGEGGAGGQKGKEVAEGTIQAAATDLPFDDMSKDTVIASHVLEHIVDLNDAVREWNRVLKPEGTLLVVCPDHTMLKTMIIDYTHVHAFTLESLKTLLRMHEFVIDDAEQTPWGNLRVKARKAWL